MCVRVLLKTVCSIANMLGKCCRNVGQLHETAGTVLLADLTHTQLEHRMVQHRCPRRGCFRGWGCGRVFRNTRAVPPS